MTSFQCPLLSLYKFYIQVKKKKSAFLSSHIKPDLNHFLIKWPKNLITSMSQWLFLELMLAKR